jgi:hypothetical protein
MSFTQVLGSTTSLKEMDSLNLHFPNIREISKMAISTERGRNCLTMAIDTKEHTPMGSLKEMGSIIGAMDPFTKANSKMDFGLGMESGSSEPKNTKDHT